MLVLFNSIAEYKLKNQQIASAMGWPSGGTIRYADENPRQTTDGKYAMPVLVGFEQFFDGMQKTLSDEEMYPKSFSALSYSQEGQP